MIPHIELRLVKTPGRPMGQILREVIEHVDRLLNLSASGQSSLSTSWAANETERYRTVHLANVASNLWMLVHTIESEEKRYYWPG